MKSLNYLLIKPEYYNIYWDDAKNKLVILKATDPDNGKIGSDEFAQDDNFTIVFTISPYLIGMLKVLNIPFTKAKRRILSALNKDLKQCNRLDKNSNLYNLLVNEFRISIA